MSRRIRTSIGLGALMALGETLAALALFSHDWAFLALQALLAFAVGVAVVLAPLPLRALPAVPIVAVGLFHAGRVLRESDGLGAVDCTLLAAHALIASIVLWRLQVRASDADWMKRALATFAAAYLVQALWVARFVIPSTLSEGRALVAVSVTLVPLCAAWLAARAQARKLAPSAAFASFAVLLAVPLFGYAPMLWRMHEQRAPPTAAPASGSRPDVYFVVLDTVRADRTSLYGNPRPTTPGLERFAQTATLYEHAQSQGIWTLPSHASLFTGLYPSEHRADWLATGMNARGLSGDVVTLAERFELDGYRTGCIAANKAIFGADFGLTQGFGTAWAELGSTAQLWVPFITAELVHALFGQRAREHIGALEQNQFAPAEEINRLALDWLGRTAGGEPRFLFLNYMEAHGQLRRPPCDAPTFGDGRPFGEWDLPDREIADALAGRSDPDPQRLARFRDWYDSQLACLDLHVAAFFDELRARGLFDKALIVVTSDHGHMLGEHRAFKHQAEIWQGLIGVPLMIKLPRQTEAARCDEVTQTADVVPALVRWIGLPVSEKPPAWVGRVDGLAALKLDAVQMNERVAPCPLPSRAQAAFSEAGRMGELAVKFPERFDTSWTAIVDGTKKYVLLGNGRRGVVDLASDPGETLRELTADETRRCDELIAAWKAGLIEPVGLRAGTNDAEEQRRLRALQQQGYVGK